MVLEVEDLELRKFKFQTPLFKKKSAVEGKE
jgi:hypothetical protein